MEAFAHAQDVEAIYRPLTDEESDVAEGLLEQASFKLRILVPNIDDAIATDDMKAVLATAAVVNAVKRVMQNPEGLRSTSFTIDDFQQNNTRDAAISTGALYIDPTDLVGLVRRVSRFGTLPMRSAL